MAIYFIQSVIGGPVKIGVAADIGKRLAALQTGSPFELCLLASTRGGRAEERALHCRFADLHAGGEWFRPEGDLLEQIALLGGKVFQARAWAAEDNPTPLRLDRSGARRKRVGPVFSEGARLTWLALIECGMSQNDLCRAMRVGPGSASGCLWGDIRPSPRRRATIFRLLAVPERTWDLGPLVPYRPPPSYPTRQKAA